MIMITSFKAGDIFLNNNGELYFIVTWGEEIRYFIINEKGRLVSQYGKNYNEVLNWLNENNNRFAGNIENNLKNQDSESGLY